MLLCFFFTTFFTTSKPKSPKKWTRVKSKSQLKITSPSPQNVERSFFFSHSIFNNKKTTVQKSNRCNCTNLQNLNKFVIKLINLLITFQIYLFVVVTMHNCRNSTYLINKIFRKNKCISSWQKCINKNKKLSN